MRLFHLNLQILRKQIRIKKGCKKNIVVIECFCFDQIERNRLKNIKKKRRASGEVSEWSKVHAWKACEVKASAGSNPVLSARQIALNVVLI